MGAGKGKAEMLEPGGLWQLGHTTAEGGRRPTLTSGPQRDIGQTTLEVRQGPWHNKTTGKGQYWPAACQILPLETNATAFALIFLA